MCVRKWGSGWEHEMESEQILERSECNTRFKNMNGFEFFLGRGIFYFKNLKIVF